jgi:hypothetical protein
MQNEEEKRWARFENLTEIMKNAPRQEPPEGFTARVMARVPNGKPVARHSLWPRIAHDPVFTTALNLGFRGAVTKSECAFYFLLTGFFYLVLGCIMMFGLQRFAGLVQPAWLSLQPLFGIVLAIGLSALGFLLYTDGRGALRAARIGTALYAVLVFLNGSIGALWAQLPVALFFAVIFSATGLAMAAFLGIAVGRCTTAGISSQEVNA